MKKIDRASLRNSKKITRNGTGWRVYILECADGTFYTGISNNVGRRVEQHNKGTASRYTRSRLPVALVYDEGCRGRSSALRKECRIKALSRKEKEEYIRNAVQKKRVRHGQPTA